MSQAPIVLRIVTNCLAIDFSYEMLHGSNSTAERQMSVDSFQNGDAFVFLISESCEMQDGNRADWLSYRHSRRRCRVEPDGCEFSVSDRLRIDSKQISSSGQQGGHLRSILEWVNERLRLILETVLKELFQPADPANDLQAMDRAFRMGQKRDV